LTRVFGRRDVCWKKYLKIRFPSRNKNNNNNNNNKIRIKNKTKTKKIINKKEKKMNNEKKVDDDVIRSRCANAVEMIMRRQM